MKLLTKEVLESLPALYSQEGVKDPVVRVKFFDPLSSWTWYATEYDPEQGIFFGFVDGLDGEWGYFSVEELESIKIMGRNRIQRDMHFTPKLFSQVKSSGVMRGATI